MPPPPPDFLPAHRRRRRLDPTRHLISRELWNRVRFHARAPPPHLGANVRQERFPVAKPRSREYYLALMHAILYELQPFRVRPCVVRIRRFFREEDGFARILSSLVETSHCVISLLRELFLLLRRQVETTDIQTILRSAKSNTSTFTVVAGVYAYYRFLAYVHDLLHAGPMVLLITMLVLIFTIGLGDDTGAQSGIPSAYSVFNRGFRRILGTVDAEQLAQQYAGGMMGMAVAGDQAGHHDHWPDNDGGVWVREDQHNEEEEQIRIQERRRRRRLERQQRRNGDDNNDEGAARQEATQTYVVEQDDERGGNEPGEQSPMNGQSRLRATPQTSRKSGKKARRRNLELRREIQRQRQAAAELGFGADGGPGDRMEDLHINMLVDEQIAEAVEGIE